MTAPREGSAMRHLVENGSSSACVPLCVQRRLVDGGRTGDHAPHDWCRTDLRRSLFDWTLDRCSTLKLFAEFFAANKKAIELSAAREIVFLLLYMAASAMTLNIFMQTRSLGEGNNAYGLAAMLEGTAKRPYVYRQLLPTLANGIANLIPEKDQEAFVEYHFDKYHLKQQYFEKAKYKNLTKQYSEYWTASYAIKFHSIYIINFLSLILLAYLLRFLAEEVIHNQIYLTSTAPIMFLLMLPLSFVRANFLYDFTELFFLSALLLSAIKGNYYLWILLLPLAVFNKESNILVPILYSPVIFYSGVAKRKSIVLALAVVLSLITYFCLKEIFFSNPGEDVVWQLRENIDYWSNLRNYLLWHDIYAPLIPFPRGLNVFFTLTLLILISVSWRHMTKQIKGLLAVSFVVSIPLWLLFCARDEMRNLSFIFLPLFLAITIALSDVVHKPLRTMK